MRTAFFRHFTLPSTCAVCRTWPACASVCQDCLSRFGAPRLRCAHCAIPLMCFEWMQPGAIPLCPQCLMKPNRLGLQACVAALDYAYPWAQLLFAYKLRGQIGLARTLAHIMRQSPAILATVQAYDYLIPVPLSRERLAVRGFNQALQLALWLHRYSGAKHCRVLANVLTRTRHTPVQAQLTPLQRWQNVRGVFALQAHCAPEYYGKKLLLLDDVMTTGASLAACARTLLALRPTALGAVVCMRTAQSA